MKTLATILVFFIVLSITSYAQLQGNYSIGGDEADYETLTEAVADLNANGIATSVIFNIDTGLYYEQISLEAIAGVSEENTITFQPSSGVATDVIISFDGTSSANYIFQLDGTDNVNFTNLTFTAANNSNANILVFTNNTDNIKVSNCIFNGAESHGNIIYGDSEVNNLSIENCSFNDADNGLNIQANGVGLQLVGNSFVNQDDHSIYTVNQDSILISNNVIRNILEASDGMEIHNCDLSLLVEKNDIVLSEGGRGIHIDDYFGSVDESGLVVNNFVSVKDGDGIYLYDADYIEIYFNSVLVWGSNTSYEPLVVDWYSSPVTAKNNIFSNEAGGYTLWIRSGSYIAELDYNDYYTTGDNIGYFGEAIATLEDWQTLSGMDSTSISAPPLFSSDTTFQINQALLNGAGIAIEGIEDDIDGDLRDTPPDIGADEFTPTGENAALIELLYPQAPFKVGSYDISVELFNSGSASLVSDSIYWKVNGEIQTPFFWTGSLTIGASELIDLGSYNFEEITAYDIKVWSSSPNGQSDIFTIDDTLSVNNIYTTIAGNYTLSNDTLADFTNFKQLERVLNFGGIDDDVTINILSGTYTEQTKLIDIPKTSPTHQLTFQSSSSIASDVVISFDDAYYYNNNYIFQLDETDNVIFNNLTFTVTNNYSSLNILQFTNNTDNIKVSNCIFNGSESYGSIIYGDGAINNLLVENCVFNDADNGIYIRANGVGLQIIGNTLINQDDNSIYLFNQDSILISQNEIRNNIESTDGIEIDNCDLGLTVEKNNIVLFEGGRGIYIDDYYGSAEENGLIVNNFVSVKDGDGIYLIDADNAEIYFNSVLVWGSNISTEAFLNQYGQTVTIKNNIFSNEAGGHAFWINSNNNISESNYNDYYTTGNNIGFLNNNNITTLEDWKMLSGLDSTSISVPPLFSSDTTFQINQALLNGAGITIEGIAEDINSDLRDAPPDIGADEFSPTGDNAALIELLFPQAPFEAGAYDISVRLFNSGSTNLVSDSIYWQVNGVIQTPFLWTGSLSTGTNELIELGSYNFEEITAYDIKVWSIKPNNQSDVFVEDDTISVNNIFTTLSGNYTFSDTLSDFTSFEHLEQVLNKGGISNNVIINILPGTYNEQIKLTDIPKTLPDYQLTFQSSTGSASDVIISFDGGYYFYYNNNYIFQLDGTDNVNFSNLTFTVTNNYISSNILRFTNNTDNIKVKNCIFNSSENYGSIIYGDDEINNLLVENSVFNDAANGINIQANGVGLQIVGNTLINQDDNSIYLSNQDSILISKNIIRNILEYSDGIVINNCDLGLTIEKNNVILSEGGRGFYIDDDFDSIDEKGLIANNFVSVKDGDGIYLYDSDYTELYFNSVLVWGTETSKRPLTVAWRSSNLIAKNNIFSNEAGGYAIWVYSSDKISALDYNDYFTTGDNLGYLGSDIATLDDWQMQSGLDDNTIAVNPFFASIEDLHTSLAVLKRGVPIEGITDDIDGDIRDASLPFIGADEITTAIDDASLSGFVSPVIPFPEGLNEVVVSMTNNFQADLNSAIFQWTVNNEPQSEYGWSGVIPSGQTAEINIGNYPFVAGTPYNLAIWIESSNGINDPFDENDSLFVNNLFAGLAGTYTISKDSTANFQSINDAVFVLDKGGVVGNVIFELTDTAYNEQFVINNVLGTSKENRVTFKSSLDSTIIHFDSDNSNNYIALLDEASHISFDNINFKSNNPLYTQLIELNSNVSDIEITNCKLFGGDNHIGIYAYRDALSNIRINHNIFSRNDYGIYLVGNTRAENVVIEHNIFNEQENSAIYLETQNAPVVRFNEISHTHDISTTGIHLYDCKNDFIVSHNKVILNEGIRGINISSYNGANQNARGLVANNFINLNGSSNTYGIHTRSSYIDFVHNSINLTSLEEINGRSIFVDGGSEQVFLNNNIVNQGGGYAFYVSNPSNIAQSNYNNIYSTGRIGYWNGNHSSLSGWQQNAGQDSNSISIEPLFISDTDLHTNQTLLSNAATPFPIVIDDIDEEPRNPISPDIGADEFSILANNLGIVEIVNPATGCGLSNEDNFVVEIKNFGSQTQSNFEVTYQIDNQSPITEMVTDSLEQGETLEYVFNTTIDLTDDTLYQVITYTALENDELAENDTVKAEIKSFPPQVPMAVTPNQTICNGDLVTLEVGGEGTFKWSTGSNSKQISVRPSINTTYTVTNTNGNGCTQTGSVLVKVNRLPPTPLISTSFDTNICAGDTIELTSSFSENITWSTGDTTQTILVSKQAFYYAENYDSETGCKAPSRSIFVDVYEEPYLKVEGLTSVCEGDGVTLTVFNGNSYKWSTDENTRSITVSPTEPTIYWVVMTNNGGCENIDSVSINIVPDDEPPGIVSNMLPADGTENLSLPVNLSWLPALNASEYDIYVWRENATRPSNPIERDFNGINLNVSNLNYGETYNWQVVSKTSCLETEGAVQTFTTRNLPDLIIQDVQQSSNAFSGQNLSVTWEVLNTGTGSTNMAQWTDAIYLSADKSLDTSIDTYLGGEQNFSALEIEDSYSNTTNFSLPNGIQGNYYIFVITDRYNSVSEQDNNNNSYNNNTPVSITLTPPPDLIVTSIIPLNTVFSGQQIDITYTVENRGIGETRSGRWTDRVYFSEDSVFSPVAVYLGQKRYSGNLEVDSSYTNILTAQIPEAISGSHFLYVLTDYYDEEYEQANELNNTTQSEAIDVILTPPPDLQVIDIKAPLEANINESIIIEWEVANEGGTPAVQFWRDKVYMSDNPNVEDLKNAIFLFEKGRSATLNIGEQYVTNRNAIIPANLGGDYYIYVQTDGNNSVFEFTNEENNITRSENPINILTPDFTVSNISLPPVAQSGDSLLVSWTINNLGNGTTLNSTWKNQIAISNNETYAQGSLTVIKTVSLTKNLAVNDSLNEQISVMLPNGITGQYFLYVIADAEDNVFENEAESNNVNTNGIPIQVDLSPWVDLSPLTLEVPGNAEAGTTINVSYTISNNGEADLITKEWLDNLYISNSALSIPDSTQILRSLSYNQTLNANSNYSIQTEINLPINLTSETYYIHLITDAEDNIYEHTAENNNSQVSNGIVLSGYPPADLSVTSFETPTNSSSGESFIVNWAVTNLSNAETLSEYWLDAIYLSSNSAWDEEDILSGEWEHTGVLNNMESYTNSQRVDLPNGISGTYYLILVTDFTQLNDDSNTTNNYKTIEQAMEVELTPPSDLVITNFEVPQTAVSGQPQSVIYSVSNQGINSTISNDWTDKFYLSTDFELNYRDELISTIKHNGTLAIGQSYTDTTEILMPANVMGNYIIIATTDANDVEYEHTNENNNTAYAAITIAQPPPSDIIVSEVELPLRANVGSPLTIDWTIQNIGQNPAIGKMKEAIYLSNDPVWDISDALIGLLDCDINLAPQAIENRNLTVDLTGVALGEYYAIVRTDILNNIYENIENNNTKASEDAVNVNVKELPLNTLSFDTLYNETGLYCRIEIPDSLNGESLLLTLKGDSINGTNELYLRYNDVPTRANYDYSYQTPNYGNQEIIIPELNVGTYYLLVYGTSTANATQSISLLAKKLNFEIRRVAASQGGNTGFVTMQLQGAKFDSLTTVRLFGQGNSLLAETIYYVDPTKLYASFDLRGVATGKYDVVAEKPGNETTELTEGFTVISGTKPSIATNVIHPEATRLSRTEFIRIEYANNGNVDIQNPVAMLQSLAGAAASLTVEGLKEKFTELDLPLTEFEGPPDILRPGANGSLVVYVKADNPLGFIIKLPNLD